MTKVQYDVTESDPETAAQLSSGFESPRPGNYHGEILEMNVKGSGGDPNKPMLEVIYELTAADKPDNQRFVENKSRLWAYYLLPGHPSYAGFVVQKTDQFLLAAGIATAKRRKGNFDTSDAEGVEVGIVVRAGKNLDGDYRGEVGSVFPVEEGETFARRDEEDEDLKGLDDNEESEPESAEPEADEDDVPPYEDWSLKELKEECEARELSAAGAKAALVARLEKDDESEPESDEDDPFA